MGNADWHMASYYTRLKGGGYMKTLQGLLVGLLLLTGIAWAGNQGATNFLIMPTVSGKPMTTSAETYSIVGTFDLTSARNSALSTFELSSHTSSTYVPYSGASSDLNMGDHFLGSLKSYTGNATQYLLISNEAIGSSGIYPSLSGHSDGTFGNSFVINSGLIVLGSNPVLAFANTDASTYDALFYDPTSRTATASFALGVKAPLLVNSQTDGDGYISDLILGHQSGIIFPHSLNGDQTGLDYDFYHNDPIITTSPYQAACVYATAISPEVYNSYGGRLSIKVADKISLTSVEAIRVNGDNSESVNFAGRLQWPITNPDVNLYRSAAGSLETDGTFQASKFIGTLTGSVDTAANSALLNGEPASYYATDGSLATFETTSAMNGVLGSFETNADYLASNGSMETSSHASSSYMPLSGMGTFETTGAMNSVLGTFELSANSVNAGALATFELNATTNSILGSFETTQSLLNRGYITSANPYAGYKVVATSGGDYTSIQSAILALKGLATSTAPYCVYVMPGTYSEAITMESYVDVVGADRYHCILTLPDTRVITINTSNCAIANMTVSQTARTSGGGMIVDSGSTAVARNFYADNCSFSITSNGASTSKVMEECSTIAHSLAQRSIPTL